jgi:hypothetical protein
MQVRRTRGTPPLTPGPLTPGPRTPGLRTPGPRTPGRTASGSLQLAPLQLGSLLGSLTRGPLRLVVVATVSALVLALPLAGCGGAPKAASPQACGPGRTAANVPVEIEVNRGQVSCAVALTVEKSYAAAIVAGHAPGNGGGGPITVSGWKCQGFATPEELKTGDVSRCVKDSVQIVAILKS